MGSHDDELERNSHEAVCSSSFVDVGLLTNELLSMLVLKRDH